MPLFQKKQLLGDSADASHAARLANEAARLWETLEARNGLAAQIEHDRREYDRANVALSGTDMLQDWRGAMDAHVAKLNALADALAVKLKELASIDAQYGGVSAMQQRIADLELAARQAGIDAARGRLRERLRGIHAVLIEAARLHREARAELEAAQRKYGPDSISDFGLLPAGILLDGVTPVHSVSGYAAALAAITYGPDVLADDHPVLTHLDAVRRQSTDPKFSFIL